MEQEFKTLVVLSVLTTVLVAGVVTTAAINPYALLGLAPVLLAIAAIVREVGGRHGRHNRERKQRTIRAKGTITRRRQH